MNGSRAEELVAISVGLLREQVEEDVVIHVVQRMHVDTQGVGNAAHIQTERFQKLDEIHLLSYSVKRPSEQLHFNYISITFQLHFNYISITFQLQSMGGRKQSHPISSHLIPSDPFVNVTRS